MMALAQQSPLAQRVLMKWRRRGEHRSHTEAEGFPPDPPLDPSGSVVLERSSGIIDRMLLLLDGLGFLRPGTVSGRNFGLLASGR